MVIPRCQIVTKSSLSLLQDHLQPLFVAEGRKRIAMMIISLAV